MEKYYFTLLSAEEYNNNKDYIPSIKEECIPSIEEEWWLRTPTPSTISVCRVNSNCGVSRDYCSLVVSNGVRPALLISNPKSVYQKGSEITRGKYKWTVLQSDNKICYALCTEIVAHRRFDSKINVFEYSEIKRWLNNEFPCLVFEQEQECRFDKNIANKKVAEYLASCTDESFFEVFELFAKKVGKDIGELDDFISWLNSTLKEIHLSWLEKEAMEECSKEDILSAEIPAVNVNLSFSKAIDIYTLFIMLGSNKSKLEHENFKHEDMIKLLVGNESNSDAKRALSIANSEIAKNKEKIRMIDDIRKQINPVVDEVINYETP